MTDRDEPVSRPPRPTEEFRHVDREAWRTTAERGLGQGTLGDLAAEVAGGVFQQPLYTAVDDDAESGYPGLAPYLRGSQAISPAVTGWRPCLRCDHLDPVVSARWITEASDRGIESAWVVLEAGERRGATGDASVPAGVAGAIAVSSLAELAPLVLAIGAAGTDVHLDGAGDGVVFAAALVAATRLHGRRIRLAGSLGWDPLGALAAGGWLSYGLDRSLELLADAAAWADRSGADLRAVTVSTLPYVSAGADPVTELAYAAATGAEYLRCMAAAGLDLAVACRRLDFRVAIGLDLFAEIAKLRALRWLWSRIVEAWGVDEPQRRAPIHAVTSPRWMTRRDPWVNMLRGTNAAFAAVAGGAELVTVLPFDAAIGPPDALGRRIAANLHTILREESHLGRIVDPAGGSYFVERLTADLAAAAWARLQEVERAGGMAAFLVRGGLRRELEGADRARTAAVATGRRPIVGVSVFADNAEAAVERPPARTAGVTRPNPSGSGPAPDGLLARVERAAAAGAADGSVLEAAVAALEAGATFGQVTAAIRGDGLATEIDGLPARRDSGGFESLRDASDAITARSGIRPRAFLVALGAPAGVPSCLDRARGWLAAAGIEAMGGAPARDANEVAREFAVSGARIACICIADGFDPDLLPVLAAALRGAGARSVAAMAGRHTAAPGCRKAGVDHLLRDGDDVIGVLASLLGTCGEAVD